MNLFAHSQFSIDHLQPKLPDTARRRPTRWSAWIPFALTALMVFTSAQATPVTVPNGDFSAAGNVGSVGGGLIGGSGTNVPIGAGPWGGTYAGALGLLAPPTLSISATTQDATISGLVGLSALGIVNNSGSFEQILSPTVEASMYYTLRADVDAGRPLQLSLLNSTHTGIAIKAGGNVVASTDTSSSDLVHLDLLQGTQYRLTLSYHAPATAPNGAIGISLFAKPQGLLTVDLLPTIHFDNVSLDVSPTTPVASVGNVTGDGQTAVVNTAFNGPLSLRALDENGNGIAGVPVTFTAPVSGPSATLHAGNQTGTTVIVTTDATGLAAVDPVANTITGAYEITAQIEDVTPATIYHLTNNAGPATVIQVPDGNGSGTQETPVNQPFALPLSVFVSDQFGNPVANVAVNFLVVPALNGASASLSAMQATTDDEGLVSVDAFANAIAGSYQVNAFTVGILGAAQFDLTNTTSGPAPVATVVVSGGGTQSTPVGTPFPSPLSVLALDANGQPVEGAQIAFAVSPAAGGAGATLSASSAMTGADGTASVSATANNVAGSYSVSASAGSGATAGQFQLTNTPGNTMTPVGDPNQSSVTGTEFACALIVRLADENGQPRSGVNVNFTSPADGASALLSDGGSGGSTSIMETTDSEGIAFVTATANDIAGRYGVFARETGVANGPSTEFHMTNLEPNDPVFGNGFDLPCGGLEPVTPASPPVVKH